MSNPQNLKVHAKGLTDSPAIVKLITLMLNMFGITGEVTARVGYRIHGSGETKGIMIKGVSVSGVVIAVQPAGNDSRHECTLVWHGQSQPRLHELLLKNLGGKKIFRPEDHDRRQADPAAAPAAVVHAFPAPAARQVLVPEAPQRTAVEADASGSLHGFTGGDGTNILLLLGEIREKHGGGEITTERFYQIMRTSGLCGSETSNHSLGQIIRWLCEEGYFEHREAKSVDYYKISARGDVLLVEKTRAAQAAIPAPALAHRPIDAQKIQAGIARLLEDIKKIDDASRELASLTPLLRACEDQIADLKKQIDPIIARRDGLAERSRALEEIVTNPQFVAAREKLRAFEAVVQELTA